MTLNLLLPPIALAMVERHVRELIASLAISAIRQTNKSFRLAWALAPPSNAGVGIEGSTANEAICSCASDWCCPAAGCMRQGPGTEGRCRTTRACRTTGCAGRPRRAGSAGTARCTRRTGTAGCAGRARAEGGSSASHTLGAGRRHGQLRCKRNAGVSILSVRWCTRRAQVRNASSDWPLPEEALMQRHAVEPAGSFLAGSLLVPIARWSEPSRQRQTRRDRRRQTGSRASPQRVPPRCRCRGRR